MKEVSEQKLKICRIEIRFQFFLISYSFIVIVNSISIVNIVSYYFNVNEHCSR